MEGPVRKVLAAAMIRRNESLITRDDETATLMTDVRLQRERSEGSSGTEPSTDSSADYSSSSETRDLNTIAEDAEKNFLRAKAMIARMVKRPFGVTNTSSYAESTTCSSNGGVDSNKFASIRSKFDHLRKKKQFSDPGDDPPCDQSIATFKSLKADDAMSFMKKGFQHKRKNELAKQILQRRSQMQMASRTGFDP